LNSELNTTLCAGISFGFPVVGIVEKPEFHSITLNKQQINNERAMVELLLKLCSCLKFDFENIRQFYTFNVMLMPLNNEKYSVAKMMDILRIMQQRGVERALEYFPEEAEFINFFKDWPHDKAQNEVLRGFELTLHVY
jgi:hypothetical protein